MGKHHSRGERRYSPGVVSGQYEAGPDGGETDLIPFAHRLAAQCPYWRNRRRRWAGSGWAAI